MRKACPLLFEPERPDRVARAACLGPDCMAYEEAWDGSEGRCRIFGPADPDEAELLKDLAGAVERLSGRI